MKLAVFQDKYADTHYPIESEEDWYRVCMQVFRERDGGQYSWYPQEPPSEPDIEKPEAPDPMPEWAEEEFNKQMRRYNGRMKSYRREQHQWELMEKAREGDLRAAVQVIELRQDAEYEGYEVIEVHSVDDDVPYWAHSAEEQIKRCSEAIDSIIESEASEESVQNAQEVLSWCVEQSDTPTKGGGGEYHQRSARRLLRYNLSRIVGLVEDDDKEEALRVAERIKNREDNWRKHR